MVDGAIIVVRVSTLKQDADMQIKDIYKYCNEKNYSVINCIRVNKSAYNKIPTEFIELWSQLENSQNEPVVLVFWDVDRLSRNVVHGIYLVDKLKKLKCQIEFVKEPQINIYTPHGMDFLRQKLSNAQLESDKISQRVTSALQAKRERGEPIHRKFGQTIINKQLVIDNLELDIIKFIHLMSKPFIVKDAHTFLNELFCQHSELFQGATAKIFRVGEELAEDDYVHFTYHQIAENLNYYKLTKRGKLWTPVMISWIINTIIPYYNYDIEQQTFSNIISNLDNENITNNTVVSVNKVQTNTNFDTTSWCNISNSDSDSSEESEASMLSNSVLQVPAAKRSRLY